MQNDPYSSRPSNTGYAPQPQGYSQPQAYGTGYGTSGGRPPVPPESYVEPPAPKKPVALIALIVAAPLLLILGLLFGSLIGSNVKQNELGPQLDQARKQASENLLQSNTAHTVISRGYPDGADFSLITKLGFPSSLQAVSVKSSESDPGLTGRLTIDLKDEMGRWIVGNPASEQGFVGEISALAMQNRWQATAWQAGTKVIVAGEEMEVSTPAQKLAFLEKMRTDSANCPQDDLVTIDFMRICTKVTKPRQQDGSFKPFMNLYGYGAIRGMPIVVLGSFLLLDGNTYSPAQQAEFQQADALPDYVKNLRSVYLDSLRKTTFNAVGN